MTRWFAILAEGNLLKTFDDIDGGKFLMPTGTATIKDAEKRDLNLSGMAQVKIGKKNSLVGGNASFGRYYRQPQLMELYGVYRGVFSNPKLKNETAIRFEIGGFVQTPSRKTTLRATYFSSFVENGIYWIANNNAIKAFNASKARIHGIELETKSSPVSFSKQPCAAQSRIRATKGSSGCITESSSRENPSTATSSKGSSFCLSIWT